MSTFANFAKKALGLGGRDGRKKDYRVAMLGLDGGGKTSLLYELKLGDRVTTIPTIGFNVEEVKPSAARFTIWDIGGQIKIRELWMHYVGEGSTPDVLLWVVDSLCPERLQESAKV
eukprot:GSChrysophyteH1.ASY1.ANO1.2341.1 assembled CDS